MTYNSIKEMIRTSQCCDWCYDEKQECFTL